MSRMFQFKVYSIIMLANFLAKLDAQDTIIMLDGREISCKVTEITPERISYFRWNQLSGPVFVENRSNIFMIKFENGEKEVINGRSVVKKSEQSMEDLGLLLVTNPKTIHSDSIVVGQLIDFRVSEDFYSGGVLLFEKGSVIKAEVVHLEKRSFLGRPGKLQLGFLPCTADDGRTVVHFGNDLYQVGRDKTVESVVLGAVVLWPLFLLKGGAVVIPANTSMGLDAYVKR